MTKSKKPLPGWLYKVRGKQIAKKAKGGLTGNTEGSSKNKEKPIKSPKQLWKDPKTGLLFENPEWVPQVTLPVSGPRSSQQRTYAVIPRPTTGIPSDALKWKRQVANARKQGLRVFESNPQYDFGGAIKDIGIGLLETTGAGAVSGALTGNTLAENFGYEYETDLGQKFGNITEKVADVQAKLAPIAAGVAGQAVGIPAPIASAGFSAIQGQASQLSNENINKRKEVPEQYTPYIQPKPAYFKFGGIPSNLINVEGHELEVSKGKILKDFGKRNSHKTGGYTYEAKPNRIIIPSKDREKYLKSDSFTRNSIERRLVLDQKKREQEELTTYRKIFKGGGLTRKEDYGSKAKPYPMVASSDFAGPHRSYPIHSQGDVGDALGLAALHNGPVANIKRIAKRKGFSIPSKKHGGNTEMAKYHNLSQEEYNMMQSQMPEFAKGGRNFKSPAAYKAWLGYIHAKGLAESTPGHQKVSIKGKPKKVQHRQEGGLNFSNIITDPKQEQGSPYDFGVSYNSDLLGGYPEFENLSSPYGSENPWIVPQMKTQTQSQSQPFNLTQNNQGFGFANTMTPKNPSVWEQSGASTTTPQGQRFDWSGVGSQAATWAPVAYNLIAGLTPIKEEKPIYNPYEAQVANIMKGRKISLDPLRRDLYAQERIGAQPLGAESQGGYLSRRTQLTANTQRELARLGVTEQEMNLGYDAEYANTLMQQGMSRVQAERTARTQTIQKMANRQQFLPAALYETSAIVGKKREEEQKKGFMGDFFSNLRFNPTTNKWEYAGAYNP